MSSPRQTDQHRISTPRLLIRSVLPQDAHDICRLRQDPLNNEHLDIEPGLSTEIFARRIAEWRTDSAQGKSARCTVMLRDDSGGRDNLQGTFIGIAGVNRFVLKEAVNGTQGEAVMTADIGVIIDSKYGGKGYGKEALEAVINYCFDQMLVEQIFVATAATNKPLQKVMEKLKVVSRLDVKPREDGKSDEFEYTFSKSAWNTARTE